ncbi:MAG TPA: hypothetical protein VFW95_07565 [Candidatus Limnocylindria bacterium]|nr:hypothetical protein [Candidatus Limnocylindria bacterium]
MTTQKLFKRRVRARMSKTGESYTAARRNVVIGRERLEIARTRLASAKELASDEKLIEATGKDWEAWIAILDRWGARDRKHGEIALYLHDEHAVPSWWTQTVTNGYERARGIRAKHQQANGFTIYASKTFAHPLESVFEAFLDDGLRAQWLRDARMSVRTSKPGKLARFDFDDGATRVLVTFDAKSAAKATAYVAHERLPDADVAEAAKVAWKTRLVALEGFLEADR